MDESHSEDECREQVQKALEKAAFEIERELVCCDVFEQKDPRQGVGGHEICYWGAAAREIVREVASGQRP